MKHQLYTLLTIGVVICFAILQFGESPRVTGAAVVEERGSDAYAVTLHHLLTQFFNVNSIRFPANACAPITESLYTNIAHTPINVNVGYSTQGPERVKTFSFITGRTIHYGTADFVKGTPIINDGESDSLVSLNVESIVRVPKDERTTYLFIDFYGNTQGSEYVVNKGRFATPSTECAFIVRNGNAYCDCEAHTISGISVAGITAYRAPNGYYTELQRALGEENNNI